MAILALSLKKEQGLYRLAFDISEPWLHGFLGWAKRLILGGMLMMVAIPSSVGNLPVT